MSTSLPHGLDEHGQADGPDIFAGELQRIVAHPGTRLDPLRDFGRAAHGQFYGRNPSAGHRNRKQGAVRRCVQIQRPRLLVCGTIAMVLGVIAWTTRRGFRSVRQPCRMPRFLDPSHAPLDPALVFLAQFSLADLEDLARSDAEFLDLFRHHRGHVHHPIALERVHDLFAIASFDAFAIVPAQGYFDWGVGVKSQNSIRHCCSPCSSFGGSSSISSSPSSSSSADQRFYFPFLFWLVVAASGLAECPDRRERSTRNSSMRTRLWTRGWSPGPRIGNGCSKMLSADS